MELEVAEGSDGDVSTEYDRGASSTPVPGQEDVWEDVLTSAQDGSEAVEPSRNTESAEVGEGQKDSEKKVLGLCGLAIDVLRTYYEEGPEACRKIPEFEKFCSYVDSPFAEYQSPGRSGKYDLTMFVHPEAALPKPPDHHGYRRVLDESIWPTIYSEEPDEEVKQIPNQSEEIGDLFQSTGVAEERVVLCKLPDKLSGSIESKKTGGSSWSFLSKRTDSSQKSVAASIQDFEKLQLSGAHSKLNSVLNPTEPKQDLNPSNELNSTRDVFGTPGTNPGLPNHSQEHPCRTTASEELNQAEINPSELDKNCTMAEVPDELEMNDWYEELDYEL